MQTTVYKIRMNIRKRTVLNHFHKWTYTAIATTTDINHFCTFTQIYSCFVIAITNYAFSRCFYPASKTSDTIMNICIRFNYFMFSLYGNIKIFNIQVIKKLSIANITVLPTADIIVRLLLTSSR